MRGSTAAGINISLLPRDCSCGGFAYSAVWGRDLFPGICGEFADGAIQEEASFPWHLRHSAFLAFGTFGTGEGLLWYGICARCAKQASVYFPDLG